MAWALDYTGRCPNNQTVRNYLAATGLPLKRAKMAGEAVVAFLNRYLSFDDMLEPKYNRFIKDERPNLALPPWIRQRLMVFYGDEWKRFGVIMKGSPSLQVLRMLARHLCKYCNFAAYSSPPTLLSHGVVC